MFAGQLRLHVLQCLVHLLQPVWVLRRLLLVILLVFTVLIRYLDHMVFNKILDHSFEKTTVVLLLPGEVKCLADVLNHGAEWL